MSDPYETQAPPHAVGVEKSVVSVLFQYPEKIHDAPFLTPEHFYLIGPRLIFEAIRERSAAGHQIEFVSFVQHLLDNGQLDKVGGAAEVTDIHNHQPTTQHFKEHLAILTAKLACRMTIAAAEEMKRAAYETPDGSEIIAVTSAPITAIHDLLTSTRPARDTKAVLSACTERFERRCRGTESPMGIETSLFEINYRFRGLHPKQTVVISAYPGTGKTTLAGQFAMDAAKAGHGTLICSLEMSGEELMDRCLAYVARRPGDCITDPLRYAREKFDTAGPTKDMLSAVTEAVGKIAGMPFAIEDMPGFNVDQIISCIRRAHRKHPLEVVMVDFAQRIRATLEMRRETREQQLADASSKLADLARELGFCLLLCSQLNKDGAAKHAEAINENADLHLQIQPAQGQGDKPAAIAVVKDRHHGQHNNRMQLILDGPNLRFIPNPHPPKP